MEDILLSHKSYVGQCSHIAKVRFTSFWRPFKLIWIGCLKNKNFLFVKCMWKRWNGSCMQDGLCLGYNQIEAKISRWIWVISWSTLNLQLINIWGVEETWLLGIFSSNLFQQMHPRTVGKGWTRGSCLLGRNYLFSNKIKTSRTIWFSKRKIIVL